MPLPCTRATPRRSGQLSVTLSTWTLFCRRDPHHAVTCKNMQERTHTHVKNITTQRDSQIFGGTQFFAHVSSSCTQVRYGENKRIRGSQTPRARPKYFTRTKLVYSTRCCYFHGALTLHALYFTVKSNFRTCHNGCFGRFSCFPWFVVSFLLLFKCTCPCCSGARGLGPPRRGPKVGSVRKIKRKPPPPPPPPADEDTEAEDEEEEEEDVEEEE